MMGNNLNIVGEIKLEEIKEQRKSQQNYWTTVLVLMFVVMPHDYVRIHVCGCL